LQHLTDTELPEVRGAEVGRRIESVEPFASMLVVMIGGRSERQRVVDGFKAGAARASPMRLR
jgi:DNA-binding response OmpR family regulator